MLSAKVLNSRPRLWCSSLDDQGQETSLHRLPLPILDATLAHQAGSYALAELMANTWTVNGALTVGDAGQALLKMDDLATTLTSTSAIAASGRRQRQVDIRELF